MNNRILLVGAGAIGGFYGALLAKAGAEVSVVCRSAYAEIKQNGYRIESFAFGDWQFMPSQVLTHAQEYQGHADYVILCSKVTENVDRVALIRAAVSAESVIVFIQNGVEIEDELLAAFPQQEIISGLAFICCNRLQPNLIKHLAYGKLTIGNLAQGISEKARRLQSMFDAVGAECVLSANIRADRWQKCLWNAAFNPLSVLSGGLTTQAILSTQESFVRQIMQEVYEIAAACGFPLPEDAVEATIAKTRVMPPYKTSMLLDFENGQSLETEAILGNSVRAGRRAGIACPNLEALYALLQLRELQIRFLTA